jgi:calcineurin-like phosphoesterase
LRVLFLAAAAGAVGLGMVRWAERVEDRAPPVEEELPEERIRVEVLNGGGRAGMAREGTDYLRDLGFDVVTLGNADAFDQDSSVVLDRVGRSDWAAEVARAMGIGRITTEPDSSHYVDVTVILGAEWEPPTADLTSGEAEVEYSWWDLRRLWN